MASAYELRQDAERRYDGPIPADRLSAIEAQSRLEARMAGQPGPSPADLRWRLDQAGFHAATAWAEMRLCCRALRAYRQKRDQASAAWQRQFAQREVHRLLARLSDLSNEWRAHRRRAEEIKTALAHTTLEANAAQRRVQAAE